MNSDQATRIVLWNIDHSWLMYVLLLPTLAIAAYGVWRRVNKWRQGQPVARFDRPWQRCQRLIRFALLQQLTWRDRFAGVFHAMLFWGFITLTIATTVVMLDHDFGIPIMHGRFYLYFQSLFVDVLGLLAIVGTLMAVARRWIMRPKKLVYSNQATWILVVIATILVTGYLLEGWRIAVTQDPWGNWSPVGSLVATASMSMASVESLRIAHVVCWWFHLFLVFGFIAWAPYTKMMHLLSAPLNIYTGDLDLPISSLKSIDFDNAPSFGINSLERFTWKDLLDLDACTECGRCTSVCPANSVGKELSPRDIILDLQKLMNNTDLVSIAAQANDSDEDEPAVPLIGTSEALSRDALWQCTTCAACVDICPVSIEQFPKIVDMRRFAVMEEAEFPDTLQDAVSSMEERGHPFRGTQFSRIDWAAGLDIPEINQVESPEVLLWVGCSGAFVERNQKVTRAFAQILQHAGVSFGILGREEKCTGDLARRIGNEFLFEQLAKENIQLFERNNVQTIVTACPHCFSTLANEYPKLGANIDVYHHTTYLTKLINQGRLAVEPQDFGQMTFHDPCYLARHNGITDQPRQLLKHAATAPVIEVEGNRKNGFCCGGGGGMSFVEETPDQRVNRKRARQILDTRADTVAVACPFCTTMLEDGINSYADEQQPDVKDVSELIWEAISRRGIATTK